MDTFQDLEQLLGVFSKFRHFPNFILLHVIVKLQIKQSRDPSRFANRDSLIKLAKVGKTFSMPATS